MLTPDQARSLFPITERVIYLQHAGSALVSTRSRESLERVGHLITEDPEWGKLYAEEWEALRSSLAGLIGVPTDDIALTRGTAQGLSLLRGLDWRPGDNVVSVRGEYPANVFPWTTLAHLGVELRLVELQGGRFTAESLFEAVDQRTRAISLSWIQWWNGYRADIVRIGAECRRAGIVFALDAIQGVGAIPIDATAAEVDLFACGGTKWLLGPPGTGFCYVRRELLDQLVPPLVGVGSIDVEPASPFEDQTDFKPGARRFEESSVSWFDIASFTASLGIISEVGIDVIEQRVLDLSSYLGNELASRGFRVVEPWPRERHESSGIVSIRPGTPAEETLEMLRQAGIVARLRPGLIRFSTHFFNTEEEIETVVDFLDKKIER